MKQEALHRLKSLSYPITTLCGRVDVAVGTIADSVAETTCPGCLEYLNEDFLMIVGEEAAYEPAYPGDVGYDLAVSERICFQPGEFMRVPTRVEGMAIPPGHWGLIIARSSINNAGDFLVLPGVIDAGWRGALFVFVHNLGKRHAVIDAGTRIAQLVLVPASVVPILPVTALPPSRRGTSGFGSSGGINGDSIE